MSTTTTTETLPRTSSATSAVVRTEARLFGRELGALFWILLFPSILLLILGFIPDFRTPEEDLGGQRVVDLYAAVCVILAMLMAAVMSMPTVIAGYRESGILRRMRTTPMHPASLLLAQVGLHAAAVLGAIVLALGVARFVHDVPLPGDVAWYAVCIVLATLAAFSIGAVITAVSPSTRIVQTVGTVALFPMMFTAGVWLPVQGMTGWLHAVVVATPLGAAAEALNDSLVGHTPDLVDLAVMVGWTVVLSLVAVRSFRWE
jgi:ABC-2 type transport system permease protein